MDIEAPICPRPAQSAVRVRLPGTLADRAIAEPFERRQCVRNLCLRNHDVDIHHHSRTKIPVGAVEEVDRAFQKNRLDPELVQARCDPQNLSPQSSIALDVQPVDVVQEVARVFG
jgi:hypothetical protein